MRRAAGIAVGTLGLLLAVSARADEAPHGGVALEPEKPAVDPDRYVLVEEFTAGTLDAGETKLGTDFEVGLTRDLMLGTDLISTAVGAPTVAGKVRVWSNGEHQIALGVRAAYLSKNTLLWGSVNEHFRELDARIIRPSVSWTNTLSPRLKLHTFWAKGFGKVHAELSDKGERKLWETKHPGADYESRNQKTKAPTTTTSETDPSAPTGGETSTKDNQERDATEQSSLTQQSIQVQSITGLAQERFQMTGEFVRANGNKVLVTARTEQSRFEQLRSSFFRLTTAHQWVWSSFQMRLGIGLQYFVMSGKDLDGEQIDAAGVQPASDISFYWRF